MITYDIVRSRRKTVAIHITKDVAVTVRAPLRIPKADIDRIINSKEKWIEDHLTRRKKTNDEKSAFVLNYGDMVLFCGKLYPIIAKDGKRAGYDGECFYLPCDLTADAVKQTIVNIYKALAKRIINEKVREYAHHMDVVPSAVRITNAKTRWGSCSGKNSINFSWRLIMADEDVIKYVVVHECMHIREHNHSSRFWAGVERVLPDYMQRQKSLKALQEKLSLENWD